MSDRGGKTPDTCKPKVMLMTTFLPRFGAILAVGLGSSALALPAQAGGNGGFFIGVAPVPLFVPPPVVYPPYYPYYPYYPPVAYAPPPAQSQPAPQKGAQQAVTYGSICRAGVYSCAVVPYTPMGSTCSCPAIGAPSYGTTY
jgi:hypothetical protein